MLPSHSGEGSQQRDRHRGGGDKAMGQKETTAEVAEDRESSREGGEGGEDRMGRNGGDAFQQKEIQKSVDQWGS